jgi:hypothetical protein
MLVEWLSMESGVRVMLKVCVAEKSSEERGAQCLSSVLSKSICAPAIESG